MDINKLFDTTVAVLERMLDAKAVVGEPVKIESTTVVPLMAIGVGFGVGGSEHASGSKNGPGQSMGTGGGGGVKPIAVLIVDANGARLETIKGSASVVGRIADSVTELARAKLIESDGDKARS